MTEKLELPGKKLKSSTTKKLQQAIMNKLETNARLESLRKEIEKSQQRSKRYTITRMKKNLSGWAHNIIEKPEERISELGDGTI